LELSFVETEVVSIKTPELKNTKRIIFSSRVRALAAPLSIAVIATGVIATLQTALQAGVSWDEPVETLRLERALAVINTQPTIDTFDSQDFGYGLVFQWLGHFANIIRANEVFGTVALTAEAYAIRHILVALISFAAIVVVGVTAGLVSRDYLGGLFASALLSAMPLWVGHSGFNSKDIPVAAGFTLISAGLVLAAMQSLSPRQPRRAIRALIFFASWLGALLAIGVRPGLWSVLLLQAALTLMAVAYYLKKELKSRTLKRQVIADFSSVLAAYFVASALFLALHPHLWSRITELPLASFKLSARFGQEAWTLTAGRLLYSQDLPWWYLPSWLLAGTPLLFLLFGLLGLVTSLQNRALRVITIPMLFQLIALPLAAVVLQSPMYDGQRHHLAFFPALAFFGGIGMRWLLDFSQTARDRQKSRKTAQAAAICAIAVAFVLPIYVIWSLFPYSYTYTNHLASLGRNPTDFWETDYLALSFREALTKIPDNGVLDAWGPSFSYLPYVHLRRESNPGEQLSTDEYWWLKLNRNADGVSVPKTCVQFDQVDRKVLGKTFVMSRIFRCQVARA
jgi:hypothetical protein